MACILNFTNKKTKKDFCKNEILKKVVIRWFEKISEAAKYVPVIIKQEYSNIPWKEMEAIREVFKNNLGDINPEEIWNAIKIDLPPLHAQIKKIASCN
ncbi:MAG: HepT-like ribonuclease domain-containing protein [Patescibacteria group bacterium]